MLLRAHRLGILSGTGSLDGVGPVFGLILVHPPLLFVGLDARRLGRSRSDPRLLCGDEVLGAERHRTSRQRPHNLRGAKMQNVHTHTRKKKRRPQNVVVL